jgi:hypothetical protein
MRILPIDIRDAFQDEPLFSRLIATASASIGPST